MNIFDQIEAVASENTGTDINQKFLASMAISAKRQADAMERIADALCARSETGQNINDMLWTITDVVQGAVNRGTI